MDSGWGFKSRVVLHIIGRRLCLPGASYMRSKRYSKLWGKLKIISYFILYPFFFKLLYFISFPYPYIYIYLCIKPASISTNYSHIWVVLFQTQIRGKGGTSILTYCTQLLHIHFCFFTHLVSPLPPSPPSPLPPTSPRRPLFLPPLPAPPASSPLFRVQ